MGRLKGLDFSLSIHSFTVIVLLVASRLKCVVDVLVILESQLSAINGDDDSDGHGKRTRRGGRDAPANRSRGQGGGQEVQFLQPKIKTTSQ